jgi:hypothetical protein
VVVVVGADVVVLLGAVVVVLLVVVVVVVPLGAVVVLLVGVVLVGVVVVVSLGVVVFVVPLGVVVVVDEFPDGAVVVVEFDGDVPESTSVVVVTELPEVPPGTDDVGEEGDELADDDVVVVVDPGVLVTPTEGVPGTPPDDAGRLLPDESPDAEAVRSVATATVVVVEGWCVTCAVPTATAPAKLIEKAAVRTAVTPT